MTVTLIWLIAFAVILFLSLKGWDGPYGRFIDRRIPKALRSRDDRWVWCVALAILGATLIVNPVSMLLTLLILLLVGWVVLKLIGWGMSKARTRK
ncbi:hypothetical protein R6258_08625 [Halomonas sp. HP20-15]|uniref:hypothetical protein n=1 Tax=Halomonas sp. HP20-15 TaxID=3085901 RepID=UPI00298280CC|nr:hypothetical protein [Halomonas sp. HP20-15]MDW5376978.1 hypothetical protein [Halomonas sp. HP20-15]